MKKTLAGLMTAGLIVSMLSVSAATVNATPTTTTTAVNSVLTAQFMTAKKPKKSKATTFAKNINNKVKKKLKIRTNHLVTSEGNLHPISKKNRYYTNTDGAKVASTIYVYVNSSKKKTNAYVKEVEKNLKKKGLKKYRFSKMIDYKGDKFEFRTWHSKTNICTVKKPFGKYNTEASFDCIKKSEHKKAVNKTKPFVTAYDKVAKKKNNKLQRGTVKKPVFIAYPEIGSSKHKTYKKYKWAQGYTMGAFLAFAKAPGKKWQFVTSGQDAVCKDFEKTKVSSKAWAKLDCIRNGKLSKVKPRK